MDEDEKKTVNAKLAGLRHAMIEVKAGPCSCKIEGPLAITATFTLAIALVNPANLVAVKDLVSAIF